MTNRVTRKGRTPEAKSEMSFYNQIMTGLNQAYEFEKGKVNGSRRRTVHIAPLPTYTPAKIKDIRVHLDMTQNAFASFLGVSTKTVEAWEAGRNNPEGPARRVLELIEKAEDVVKKTLLTR